MLSRSRLNAFKLHHRRSLKRSTGGNQEKYVNCRKDLVKIPSLYLPSDHNHILRFHGVPEDCRTSIFARLCVVALADVRLQITITYSDSKLLLLGREEDDCISSGRRAGKARIRLATACRRIPGSKTIQQHIHTALCCRAHPRMQHRDS